jgi:hypothetical protein
LGVVGIVLPANDLTIEFVAKRSSGITGARDRLVAIAMLGVGKACRIKDIVRGRVAS